MRLRYAASTATCVGLLAAAAACGGPPPAGPAFADSTSAAATSAAAAPAVPDAGPPAPLTGLPIPAAAARRPLLAVAVGASPRGLDRADVVVEELSTPVRYVGLYQSRDAEVVGPVAQTRPVDAQLLSVGKPAMGYAGGKAGFVDQLRKAGVVDVGSAAVPAAYRVSDGAVYTSTAALFGQARGAGAAPQLLTFAAAGEALATRGVVKAGDVTVSPPGSATQRWTWVPASRGWQRADLGLRVSNVILQEVPYRPIEPIQRSRATAPAAKVLGSGRCTVLSGPAAVGCGWIRKGADAVTNYVDPAGTPLRLAPGSTWIVLVPPGTAVTRR